MFVLVEAYAFSANLLRPSFIPKDEYIKSNPLKSSEASKACIATLILP